MSHFTVLVIGPDHEQQLGAFHEFECTGEDDEHVVDVDITDEARREYAEASVTKIKLADGTIRELFGEDGNWAPDLLRDPTPEELAKKNEFLSTDGDKIRWNN